MRYLLWLVLFALVPVSMIVSPVNASEWYEEITPQEYVERHNLCLPEDLQKYLDNPDPDEVLTAGQVDILEGWNTVVVTYVPYRLIKQAKMGDKVELDGETLARARFCTCKDCLEEKKDPLCSFELFIPNKGWVTLYHYTPPPKEQMKKKLPKKWRV